VGWDTSIAVDSNNKVHISYYNFSDKDLKYATNAYIPFIDQILGVKEPGLIVRVIGTIFGDTQGNSIVHMGPKIFNSSSPKIKLWTDTKIRIRLPNYQCSWFNGQDYKYIRAWVNVDGLDSNKKWIKVIKPSICP